jgi:hypothetical protein
VTFIKDESSSSAWKALHSWTTTTRPALCCDPDFRGVAKIREQMATLAMRESQQLTPAGPGCRLRAKVDGLAAHISHAMLADEGLWTGGGLMDDVAACLSSIRQHERECDLRPVSTALLTLGGSRQDTLPQTYRCCQEG